MSYQTDPLYKIISLWHIEVIIMTKGLSRGFFWSVFENDMVCCFVTLEDGMVLHFKWDIGGKLR